VTTPSGRPCRCSVIRAVIAAAAALSITTSCTGTPAVIQPQGQPSTDPHITYLEGHVIPHRTFPPAPVPSLVHGELTLTQANSWTTTTSIPVGTVVHLRVESRFYNSPMSTDPLVLAQTSPSPPGVLADFRAVRPGSADLVAHEVVLCPSCRTSIQDLVFHITVRGS